MGEGNFPLSFILFGEIPLKYCYSCKERKELTLFNKNKSKKDGLASECKECKKARDKKYSKENAEVICQRASTWYYENKEYAIKRNREYGKYWRQNNKAKNAQKSNKYRASKLKASPAWIGKEEQFLIEEFYELAQIRSKTTNTKWHVDHIIPLKGKYVCGLHVAENLQVIMAKDNLTKGNKYVSV